MSEVNRSINAPARISLDLILVLILLCGAYLRFTGLFWGENQFLHPDERFLIWVGTDIDPVTNLQEYFNTANSTLNPHNQGHGFYVYGTLPMFLTRYVVEWIFGHSGFPEMTQVGRTLSAIADLFTVLLVYLVARRLYSQKVALLSSAFSAFAVLQIQQSHFFTMDTFINFFTFLAFYFAIRIARDDRPIETIFIKQEYGTNPNKRINFVQFLHHPLLLPSIGFGIALGMAMSSKLNAMPMAIMLPAAIAVRMFNIPPSHRRNYLPEIFALLIISGLLSIVTFRLLQPYAFNGPGFFGITPNTRWLANLQELRAQSNGDVDFPPAMQWARRPFWFSGKNLLLWGVGIPFGILALAGFFMASWRTLKSILVHTSEWQQHILILGWTGAYFFWQSMSLNPSMRYQLPIYPTLAILAGWFIFAIYDQQKFFTSSTASDEAIKLWQFIWQKWTGKLVLFLGLAGLAATFLYAFAFSQIYTKPITRIEASRWIYQNIPGAINLHIQSENKTVNQPLPFPYQFNLSPGFPYTTNFQPKVNGYLKEMYLPVVKDNFKDQNLAQIELSISSLESPFTDLNNKKSISASSVIRDEGDSYTFIFEPAPLLEADKDYSITISVPGETVKIPLAGDMTLGFLPKEISDAEEFVELPVINPSTGIDLSTPLSTSFTAGLNGNLTQIFLPVDQNISASLQPGEFKLNITSLKDASIFLESELIEEIDPEGKGYHLILENPIPVDLGSSYSLNLHLTSTDNDVQLKGSGIANEGEWDDGLPLRLDGYDGFAGIYPLDLNFNMYWDDNPEKLDRFIRILDEADYIVISSNRQWGSLSRIPERFPLISLYYRELLGCPDDRQIEWCYKTAIPGMFAGNLGFDLIKVFSSEPGIGSFRLNDQFAEEAFTVYDHPKVFIFKKNGDYDTEKVRSLFNTANFSEIVKFPPMKYPQQPVDLKLPEDRLNLQRTGGTWSEIFDRNSVINRYQLMSILVWYLSITLLGLITYPLMRLALSGLDDKGYPLARSAGLLILSYIVWLAGSYQITFSRSTITAALMLIIILASAATFYQRSEIRKEIMQKKSYFLRIEILFLLFFLIFLVIRLGNPDLWHPWKGGEKPMDFSYLNAVLKSSIFPPYDPWFAGGYLNYYYYGFVYIGVLIKFLGINPSIAYNLFLPTIFSIIAMGGFSVAWNLYIRIHSSSQNITKRVTRDQTEILNDQLVYPNPFWVGIAGAIATAILGNLGTVRMIITGYQKIAAQGEILETASLFSRILWTLQGFFQTVQGTALPYSIGDWYWIPSRNIPAPGDVEPITEFPFFTVLYGDPHAHLFALPISLLALGIAISFILGKSRWQGIPGFIASFFMAGLAFGALKPTNTSDYYPYLGLGIAALVYSTWSYYKFPQFESSPLAWFSRLNINLQRVILSGCLIILFVFLTRFLFYPYEQWSLFGYGKLALWKGTRTPLHAYLTHWGVFLFVIISWMVSESLDWMEKTPASSLRKLSPHRHFILIFLISILIVVITLWLFQVWIVWFVLPIAMWAGVLLLRPNLSDSKRIVLFLIGTGLILTLLVETLVVVGDIGRMNTVFKFYLQVWTFFSISAAVSMGWLLQRLTNWSPGWKSIWITSLSLLVIGAFTYPVLASAAKIKDRMAPEAPHTLDGMEFMRYANYTDEWGEMDLNQDYEAIRWMQENIEGSPVIVEANLRALYRWGSRYSIYTGLPGVVGWEWHQQQQRNRLPASWITDRIAEIDNFYNTTEIESARSFLRKYGVRYIIVGQQERGHNPGKGLNKFEDADGIYWNEVYRSRDTVIYKVIEA